MFYVLQNESTAALRRVPILLTDAATGTTAQTGVATTTIFPYVNINGNAFIGGTGNVGEAGYGQYYYEFEVNEIATLGLAGIHITAAGCRDYDAISQVAAFNLYGAAGAGISAGDVWEYDISAISTAGTAGSQLNLAASGSGASTYAIAEEVWNFDISGYTSLAGGYITNINGNVNDAKSNTNNIPLQIWGDDLAAGANSPYLAGTAGTILYTLGQAGVALTAGDVWDYAGGRTITGGIADTVTSVTNDVNVSTVSMAGVANTVWSTLTAPYTTHATFGHQVLRSDNAATIGEVTLHQSGGSKRVDADVHAFVNNTASATAMLNILTGIGASITSNITGNLSGSVGSVTNPVSVTTASMTGIAGTVWSTDISGYSSPSAGFDLANASSGAGLTAGDVWDFSITGFGGTNSAAVYLTDTNFTVGNIETYVQNQTPQDVWTYAGIEGRTITGGTADTVTLVTNDVNVSTGSMTGIANTVWSTDISGITTAGTAGSQLNLAASPSGAGLTSGDVTVAVWDAPVAGYGNSGTYGNLVLRSDIPTITGNVTLWNGAAINGVYSDVYRIDADYNAAIALKDILTGIGSSITGNITGDLSGSVGSVTSDVNVSTPSMTGIAGTVWSTDISGYTSPSAGYSLYNASGGVAVTAGDIWSYATREITGGIADTVTTVSGNVLGSVLFIIDDVTLSAGTQASIANSVWSTNVSGYTSPSAGYDLTQASAGGGGITAGDVWNYDLSSYTPLGISAGSYLFFNTDTIFNNLDIASSSIGSSVWSYAGRTITGGIADTVTTLTNRSGFAITGGTITTVSDKTGYSLSASQTFNVTGNITGNVSGSVGSVTNPVTFNSAQYAGIASSVWNAATRTLTSGTGVTPGDVWTYATRTLTSGAGITVNAATNIINGPYLVKSNVDGQDGNLDVIRGMVQDIQLTVTDAFQNPFDVTSLGMAVNFYDQAGSLVTSYATTNLYAPGGLIQFTLDQVVTGNEGRYNLILSAAGSGNTIKFGPLQTLVRPF